MSTHGTCQSHACIHWMTRTHLTFATYTASVSDTRTVRSDSVVHCTQPESEVDLAPNPTTHLTTPVTTYQQSISLAALLLVALLSIPHRIAKLECEAGRCDVLPSENE